MDSQPKAPAFALAPHASLPHLFCAACEHLIRKYFHTHIPHTGNALVRGRVCFSEQETDRKQNLILEDKQPGLCSEGFKTVSKPRVYRNTGRLKGNPQSRKPFCRASWWLCQGVVGWDPRRTAPTCPGIKEQCPPLMSVGDSTPYLGLAHWASK